MSRRTPHAVDAAVRPKIVPFLKVGFGSKLTLIYKAAADVPTVSRAKEISRHNAARVDDHAEI
jgi:hypothetical protein